MITRNTSLLYLLLLFPAPLLAWYPQQSKSIEVEVVAADGRAYPVYATGHRSHGSTYRAYLEATHGSDYAIRVSNRSSRRLGLVIAVDGRNIISGSKSELGHGERMYILEPRQSASYEGWRTSNKRVNRFFFTSAEDSYAGAWQDHSAMGVIAVAVFDEKQAYRPRARQDAPRIGGRSDLPAEAESSADRAEAGPAFKKENRQAGTGFGQEKYSYARVVSFKPQRHATEKHFYRYEWRETLCQKGVIDCFSSPPNRFWPEHDQAHGFVPYPPAR